MCLKTLILCVDRDDDLGEKAGVQSPVIGRRRNLEAAMALGLADPEDSDTNAILAAVHVHDEEARQAQGGGDQVEVATITGMRSLGVRGDRKLTSELEEVLALVRPDQVVLVSDGAEDERILPILQSHAKVVHVHRSVVKQAPRLEGFYYVLTRILDDEKQAKRFVLPLSIVLLVWSAGYLSGRQDTAWGIILAFIGLWLFIHGMKWEASVGRVFADLGASMRSGKLSLLANVIMVLVLVWGVIQGIDETGRGPVEANPLYTLHFMQSFLPFVMGGLLIHVGGRLLDGWVREGRTGLGHWMAGVSLIAFWLLGDWALRVSIIVLEGRPYQDLLEFDLVLELLVGVCVALGGLVLGRYIRDLLRPARAAA